MSLDKTIAFLERAREVVVQLSLVVQRGEAAEASVLARWEPPVDAAKVAAEVHDLCQQDANAARSRCSYVLTALSKVPVHRRLAFTAEPTAEPTVGPTEPPTTHGVNAMLMRHLEAEKRVQTGGRLELDQSWSKLFEFAERVMERQERQLDAAAKREAEAVELYAAMRGRDHEHELALAQLGAEERRSDQVLKEVVAPVMPHVAPQLSRAIGAFVVSKIAPTSPAPAAAAAKSPAPAAPAASPSAQDPVVVEPATGADAPAEAAPAPVASGLRDLVALLATHDVDPERVADLVASTLPEADREAAKVAVHKAVREAFAS